MLTTINNINKFKTPMDDSIVQALPEVKDMVTQAYTYRNWLQYYFNIFTRRVIASTVDVEHDANLKAENANKFVDHTVDAMGNMRQVQVKFRLEERKEELEKCIGILGAIKRLMALSDEDLAQYWTKEYLTADPEVLAEVMAMNGIVQKPVIPEDVKQQYTVVADAGVFLTGTDEVTPKGTIILLDPKDSETIALLEANNIAISTVENTQEQETAPAQQQYKFLVDFGTEKAGDTIMLPGVGWTPEQVAERVADGSIALVVTDQEQQDSAPETKTYNVISDVTVDGAVTVAGAQIELTDEQANALPDGSVTLA